jgi:predicted acylesterase/phospholipase RssA
MTSKEYNNNKYSQKSLDDFLGMTDINDYIDKQINGVLGKTHGDIPKTTVVLSGGGIKGIAHIGALKALEEKQILKNIKVFAGTSIGGMIAALYIIGYTPDEMYNFIELFNIKKMRLLDPKGFFNKFGANLCAHVEPIGKHPCESESVLFGVIISHDVFTSK